jgi:hypothetical protein
MAESHDTPAWLIYERCVAAYCSEELGSLDVTVLPNVPLRGCISGEERQIDVLIDGRWSNDTRWRIIVDAKARKRPIDIPDVEGFEGMMCDCRAARGVIVCTSGWTAGAERRAQNAITISLLDFKDAVDEYRWEYESCLGSCSLRKRRRRGGVLWGEWGLSDTDSPTWILYQLGKCDGCHSFHVWCQDCGSKFAVPDGRVVRCGCDEREWASVPESEASAHVGEPESIWLMMREFGGTPVPLDRRPIR